MSNGGVGGFTFTGNNGWSSQTITTITSGVGVAGATQILTGASTATTITESAPPAGFALTAVSCSGLGAGGTATVNLSTRSVLLDAAATAPGSAIACTFTNTRALVRVQKTTLGGFGGPFAFARTNLAAITNITTTAEATATPASPSALNVTTVGTAVTITETPIAGYALTAASCTDANSAVTGNVGVIGSFSGNVLDNSGGQRSGRIGFVPAFSPHAAAWCACRKITMGGFAGPVTLHARPIWRARRLVLRRHRGRCGPVAPAAITVTTVGTAVTLTETVASGYALTAASCTDANSAVTGNVARVGTLAGNVLTIPAADVRAGSDYTCTFTNTRLPTITLTKISNGAVGGFTFNGDNGFGAAQTITTVTSGVGVAGANPHPGCGIDHHNDH